MVLWKTLLLVALNAATMLAWLDWLGIARRSLACIAGWLASCVCLLDWWCVGEVGQQKEVVDWTEGSFPQWIESPPAGGTYLLEIDSAACIRLKILLPAWSILSTCSPILCYLPYWSINLYLLSMLPVFLSRYPTYYLSNPNNNTKHQIEKKSTIT